MTAQEMFILRTNATAEVAEMYIEMAQQKVREFLRYEAEEDVTKFASAVADVAVLYYQRDQQIQTMNETASTGLKSESFTEGAVSASKNYLTAGDVFGMYDARTDKVLDGIRRYRRAHVVTGVNSNANTG